MTAEPHFEQLVSRYLDGLVTKDELSELQSRLITDPTLARAFVAQARLEGDLRIVHRATAESASGRLTERLVQANRAAVRRSARHYRPRRNRWLWPLALAATLLMATGLLWWTTGREAAVAYAFTVAGRGVPAGTSLSNSVELVGGGRIELEAGAEAFAGGTGESPVLRLRRGRADCQVATRAGRGPFIVQTPQGDLRVVGTAFRVAVTDHTDLSVHEGVIEVSSAGGTVAVTPGQRVRVTAGLAPSIFHTVDRVMPLSSPTDWTNCNGGTIVASDGVGPTGAPALKLHLMGAPNPWAGVRWPAGTDWRQATGLSLVYAGTGNGRRLELELLDNGPGARDTVTGKDSYERFKVSFTDDRPGWQERRFPFDSFVRRPDLWADMPNDGLTLAQVHGLTLIANQSQDELRVERIAVYVTH